MNASIIAPLSTPNDNTKKNKATKKIALVLLSGGLDSATTLAIAEQQGFSCYALSFAYGQKQSIELEAAAIIAEQSSVIAHRVATIDLGTFATSALTSSAIKVPKDRTNAEISDGIPSTYVPARNTIFLSYALAWAEVLGAYDIFLGVNAVDYSGYPDCRPEFITAFENLANLATGAAVSGAQKMTIHAPLMAMTKGEIILTGTRLNVDYALTHSCYDPQKTLACGGCDACQLRHQGFMDAGIEDPTRYTQTQTQTQINALS